MTDNVEVKFGGDTSGLDAAAKHAADSVQNVANASKGASDQTSAAWTQVSSAFKGVGDTVKSSLDHATGGMTNFAKESERAAATSSTSMMAAGVAIGSVLSSAITKVGEKIGELIRDMLALPGEVASFIRSVNDVARELGSSAQQAYVFSNAAADIGASAGEADGAIRMLSMRLKTNEDDLNRMGVATRGANGELLDQQTIFYNAIDAVNGYKQGTDRNTAASEIFGRSITGTSRILEMSREKTAENAAEMQAFGDIITDEVLSANEEYIESTNHLNNAKDALSHQIGYILIPVFSQLKNWVADVMPAAINFLKGVVGSLTIAFWGLANGVRVVWEIINGVVNSIAVSVTAVASALFKIAAGDFAGAWKALGNGGKEVVGAWQGAYDNILKSSEDTAAKIKAVWKTVTGTGDAAGAEGGGSRDFKAEPKKGKADKSLVDAQLGMLKAQSKAESDIELEALKQSEAAYADYYRRNIITAEQYYEAKTALEQRAIDVEMDNLKKQQAELQVMESAKGLKDSERIKIKTQEAQVEGQLAVLEMKRMNIATQNARAMTEAEQRQYDALEKIRSRAEQAMGENSIALERQTIDQKRALRVMDQAEYLAATAELENQLYQVKLKSLQDEMVLADLDVVKRAEVYAQIEALEQQHQLAMTGIKNAAALEQSKYQLGAIQSIQAGMAQNLQQLMMGQVTFAKFMQNTWKTVFSAITGELAKFAAAWIAKKLAMMLFGKATALSEVATAAGIAGANGVASWALAPWPINIGAPAFGAAMSLAAMAFAPTASAAGGFDIPAGVNPVVQTHAKEMILPAKYADVIRSMAEGSGGSGGSAGGGDTYQINVSAVDASGVRQFFLDNQPALVEAIKNANRNGMR